jgi:hypothetical protein
MKERRARSCIDVSLVALGRRGSLAWEGSLNRRSKLRHSFGGKSLYHYLV